MDMITAMAAEGYKFVRVRVPVPNHVNCDICHFGKGREHCSGHPEKMSISIRRFNRNLFWCGEFVRHNPGYWVKLDPPVAYPED